MNSSPILHSQSQIPWQHRWKRPILSSPPQPSSSSPSTGTNTGDENLIPLSSASARLTPSEARRILNPNQSGARKAKWVEGEDRNARSGLGRGDEDEDEAEKEEEEVLADAVLTVTVMGTPPSPSETKRREEKDSDDAAGRGHRGAMAVPSVAVVGDVVVLEITVANPCKDPDVVGTPSGDGGMRGRSSDEDDWVMVEKGGIKGCDGWGGGVRLLMSRTLRWPSAALASTLSPLAEEDEDELDDEDDDEKDNDEEEEEDDERISTDAAEAEGEAATEVPPRAMDDSKPASKAPAVAEAPPPAPPAARRRTLFPHLQRDAPPLSPNSEPPPPAPPAPTVEPLSPPAPEGEIAAESPTEKSDPREEDAKAEDDDSPQYAPDPQFQEDSETHQPSTQQQLSGIQSGWNSLLSLLGLGAAGTSHPASKKQKYHRRPSWDSLGVTQLFTAVSPAPRPRRRVGLVSATLSRRRLVTAAEDEEENVTEALEALKLLTLGMSSLEEDDNRSVGSSSASHRSFLEDPAAKEEQQPMEEEGRETELVLGCLTNEGRLHAFSLLELLGLQEQEVDHAGRKRNLMAWEDVGRRGLKEPPPPPVGEEEDDMLEGFASLLLGKELHNQLQSTMLPLSKPKATVELSSVSGIVEPEDQWEEMRRVQKEEDGTTMEKEEEGPAVQEERRDDVGTIDGTGDADGTLLSPERGEGPATAVAAATPPSALPLIATSDSGDKVAQSQPNKTDPEENSDSSSSGESAAASSSSAPPPLLKIDLNAFDANIEPSTSHLRTVRNIPTLCASAFDYVAIAGHGIRKCRRRVRKKRFKTVPADGGGVGKWEKVTVDRVMALKKTAVLALSTVPEFREMMKKDGGASKVRKNVKFVENIEKVKAADFSFLPEDNEDKEDLAHEQKEDLAHEQKEDFAMNIGEEGKAWVDKQNNPFADDGAVEEEEKAWGGEQSNPFADDSLHDEERRTGDEQNNPFADDGHLPQGTDSTPSGADSSSRKDASGTSLILKTAGTSDTQAEDEGKGGGEEDAKKVPEISKSEARQSDALHLVKTESEEKTATGSEPKKMTTIVYYEWVWEEYYEPGGFVTFVSLRHFSETRTVYLPFVPKNLSPIVWCGMSFLIVLGEEDEQLPRQKKHDRSSSGGSSAAPPPPQSPPQSPRARSSSRGVVGPLAVAIRVDSHDRGGLGGAGGGGGEVVARCYRPPELQQQTTQPTPKSHSVASGVGTVAAIAADAAAGPHIAAKASAFVSPSNSPTRKGTSSGGKGGEEMLVLPVPDSPSSPPTSPPPSSKKRPHNIVNRRTCFVRRFKPLPILLPSSSECEGAVRGSPTVQLLRHTGTDTGAGAARKSPVIAVPPTPSAVSSIGGTRPRMSALGVSSVLTSPPGIVISYTASLSSHDERRDTGDVVYVALHTMQGFELLTEWKPDITGGKKGTKKDGGGGRGKKKAEEGMGMGISAAFGGFGGGSGGGDVGTTMLAVRTMCHPGHVARIETRKNTEVVPPLPPPERGEGSGRGTSHGSGGRGADHGALLRRREQEFWCTAGQGWSLVGVKARGRDSVSFICWEGATVSNGAFVTELYKGDTMATVSPGGRGMYPLTASSVMPVDTFVNKDPAYRGPSAKGGDRKRQPQAPFQSPFSSSYTLPVLRGRNDGHIGLTFSGGVPRGGGGGGGRVPVGDKGAEGGSGGVDSFVIDAIDSISDMAYLDSVKTTLVSRPSVGRRWDRDNITHLEKSRRLLRQCSSWTKLDDTKENRAMTDGQVVVSTVRCGPLPQNQISLTMRRNVIENGIATPSQHVLAWLCQREDYYTAASVALHLLHDFVALRDLRASPGAADSDDERSYLEGLLDGIIPLEEEVIEEEPLPRVLESGAPMMERLSSSRASLNEDQGQRHNTVTSLADMTVACLVKGGIGMSRTLEGFLGRNAYYDASRACLMLAATAALSVSGDKDGVSSVMGTVDQHAAAASDAENPMTSMLWPIRCLLQVAVTRDCMATALLLLNATIPNELRRRMRKGSDPTSRPPLGLCESIVTMIVTSSPDAARYLLSLVDEDSQTRYWYSLDYDTQLALSLISIDGKNRLLREPEVRAWVLEEINRCLEAEGSSPSDVSDDERPSAVPSQWLKELCAGCLYNAGCHIETLFPTSAPNTREVPDGSAIWEEEYVDPDDDGEEQHLAEIKSTHAALVSSPGSGGLDFDVIIPALLVMKNRSVAWRDDVCVSTQAILDAACYLAGRHPVEEPSFAFDGAVVMRQCAVAGNVSAGAHLIGGRDGLVLKCCDVLIQGAGMRMDAAERLLLKEVLPKQAAKGKTMRFSSGGDSSSTSTFHLTDGHRHVLWLIDEHVLSVKTYGEFETVNIRGRVDPVFAARVCLRTWLYLMADGNSDGTVWLVSWLRRHLGIGPGGRVSRKRLACAALTRALLWPDSEEAGGGSASNSTILANALEVEVKFLLELAQSCCGLIEAIPPSVAEQLFGDSQGSPDIRFSSEPVEVDV